MLKHVGCGLWQHDSSCLGILDGEFIHGRWSWWSPRSAKPTRTGAHARISAFSVPCGWASCHLQALSMMVRRSAYRGCHPSSRRICCSELRRTPRALQLVAADHTRFRSRLLRTTPLSIPYQACRWKRAPQGPDCVIAGSSCPWFSSLSEHQWGRHDTLRSGCASSLIP